MQTGQQLRLKLGTANTTRDFIDVRDVASASLLLLRDEAPDGIYNVASGVERPIERLIEMFLGASGLRVEMTREGSRTEDVPRHFAAIDHMAGLGFRTEFDLADSVAAVWSYYKHLWVN